MKLPHKKALCQVSTPLLFTFIAGQDVQGISSWTNSAVTLTVPLSRSGEARGTQCLNDSTTLAGYAKLMGDNCMLRGVCLDLGLSRCFITELTLGGVRGTVKNKEKIENIIKFRFGFFYYEISVV